MKKGSDLLDVFSNLNEMLKTVESIDGIEFARDENYGYVTSCPSNLGTGMRALYMSRSQISRRMELTRKQRKFVSLWVFQVGVHKGRRTYCNRL